MLHNRAQNKLTDEKSNKFMIIILTINIKTDFFFAKHNISNMKGNIKMHNHSKNKKNNYIHIFIFMQISSQNMQIYHIT
jgi:hypothetical protein